MATPIRTHIRKMQRVTDAESDKPLHAFMRPSKQPDQPDFIISAPMSGEPPEAVHDRRVRQAAKALQELSIVFRQNVLPFQGGGSTYFPVHFDADPSGWSFQVHTTLAVGGIVRAGRQNLGHPLIGAYAVSEAEQRLREGGWPEYVDPDVIRDGVIWQDNLSPGDTTVLHVGNVKSPDLPAGSWHEFTAPSSGRRIAVTHFTVDPLVLQGWDQPVQSAS